MDTNDTHIIINISMIEHMIAHAAMEIYHSIRKYGYEDKAFNYYKSLGYSETSAQNKANAFAEQMEEAKERNASKSECKAICLKHNLPISLFF